MTAFFKRFFTKKRIIWTIIILLVGGFIAWQIFGKNGITDIQTDIVKRQDLKQTVLATGQVTSETDLSLSFKVSGVVQAVMVKVGDKVKKGQGLAYLNQNNSQAALTQAQGALAQARANYQKVLSGASSEEVAVTQVALDNAKIALDTTKKQQQVLVDNAYKALLNSTFEAVPDSANTNDFSLTVSGSYSGTEQGIYQILQEGRSFYVRGLENAGSISFNNSASVPLPVGTKGLYVTFPSSVSVASDKWYIAVPNTKAANYVTNYNAYQAALQTQSVSLAAAQNAVAAAQAALDLKKAQARPADLAVAEAQVLTAEGQVQAASADLENTVVRAPADGTITKLSIKVGELATALQEAVILQDVGNLHIEVNISEANIAAVKTSQTVTLTFDALGADREFKGVVQEIDPASTVVSGVVNYKVTVGLDKLEEIRPGMTANISILSAEKKGVLAIPARSVLNRDGGKYVRLITDAKAKTYKEAPVDTGLEADGGLVEILAGLSEGDEVVTFIKVKN